jgi:hypothetical protein
MVRVLNSADVGLADERGAGRDVPPGDWRP